LARHQASNSRIRCTSKTNRLALPCTKAGARKYARKHKGLRAALFAQQKVLGSAKLLRMRDRMFRGNSTSHFIQRQIHFERPLMPAPLDPQALPHIFFNRSVAILLLGEAFRSGKGGSRDLPCNRASVNAQHEATISYVRNVAEPLELLGASVQVLFTFPLCSMPDLTSELRALLETWLAPRVAGFVTIRSPHFDASWANAYKLLSDHMRRRGEEYDFVLHARHDQQIEHRITEWPANFSNLLFEQECRHCSEPPGCICGSLSESGSVPRCTGLITGVCTADHLMWIPRRFLGRVSKAAQAQVSTIGKGHQHRFVHTVLGSRGGKHDGWPAQLYKTGDQREISFMFPPTCTAAMHLGLTCPYTTLRPRRHKG